MMILFNNGTIGTLIKYHPSDVPGDKEGMFDYWDMLTTEGICGFGEWGYGLPITGWFCPD